SVGSTETILRDCPGLSRASFLGPLDQALYAECRTPDSRWAANSGSGPLALPTPSVQVPGLYAEPSNFKSRVAHPQSWDIGPSTIAARTSLNMVHSCQYRTPVERDGL